METVNIREAKARLLQLVEKAATGEDVVICRNGRPVARLTGLSGKQAIRYGVLTDQIEVAEDFDLPLPDEVIGRFEGR
jgi:prevent-host-death family protein